jgi:hypothetical protein
MFSFASDCAQPRGLGAPAISNSRNSRENFVGKVAMREVWSNVRDQRRRAVGAPLADRNLSAPGLVPASGVPTRDDRCIA